MSPFLSLCVLVVSLFCLPYFFPCSSICFILVSSACRVFLGLLISMPMSSLRVFHLVNCYFMCTVSSFASRFVLICSCYVIMCFHFTYHPSVYIYIISGFLCHLSECLFSHPVSSSVPSLSPVHAPGRSSDCGVFSVLLLQLF